MEHVTRTSGFLAVRGVILLMACASPHPTAGTSTRPPVRDPGPVRPPVLEPERHDEPPVEPPSAPAAPPVPLTNADVCSNTALPPAFETDGDGARPALPKRSFDDCAPVDLDGKPPCEVACTVVAPAPDFRSGEDGRTPNFHMLGHAVYFAATSPARQLGRITTYDGPLDALNPRHAATSTTVAFIDHQTSPPTLELRSGSCLYQCNGPVQLAPGKSEAECRAACPPLKRYRYDGKQLQLAR